MGVLKNIQDVLRELAIDGEFQNEIRQCRRYLHAHPELSNQEYDTTEFIREQLAKLDIQIMETTRPLRTGVIAFIGQGQSSKNLYLRGDIDALPMEEQSDLAFMSQNQGVAHTCGHDIHTTALLYAAKFLKQYESLIDGRLFFIFQPAEENMTGALEVIGSGIFEEYPPTHIVGLHTWPGIDEGKIGLKKGAFSAASDYFKLTVQGKGGHGAHPETTVDPILISGHILIALQSIVSRNIEAVESAVITVGKIQGGTAANVIPNFVEMEGTARTTNTDIQKTVKDRMYTLLPSIAQGFGGDCQIEYREGVPPVINDGDIVDVISTAANSILGDDNVVWLDSPSMGSEDFAHYLKFTTGVIFRIGTGTADERSRLGLHNSSIVFGENAIFAGIATFVGTALEYFRK